MGERSKSSSSSKRHRSRSRSRSPSEKDKDKEKSHHRHRSSSKHKSSNKHHGRSSKSKHRKHDSDQDENDFDQDMWVEKEVPKTTTTAKDDDMLGRDSEQGVNAGTFQVGQMPTIKDATRGQDQDFTDGYGEGDVGGSRFGGGSFGSSSGGGQDFFSSLGTERKRKEPPKPAPEDTLKNKKIINAEYLTEEGKMLDIDQQQKNSEQQKQQRKAAPTPGSAGSSWRMARLRRVYETAQDENRPVEEVALERYGDLEAFEQAKEEQRILDGKQRAPSSSSSSTPRSSAAGKDEFGRDIDSRQQKEKGEKEYGRATQKSTTIMFNQPASSTSTSASLSRTSSSFRKPGEPDPSSSKAKTSSSSSSKASTPIPSVFAPQPQQQTQDESTSSSSKRPLSPTSLNKLQAKAIKARLINADNATDLEAQYQRELELSKNPPTVTQSSSNVQVEMLPTVDIHGRLYDIGTSKDTLDQQQDQNQGPRSKKKNKEQKFETRDSKTGDIVRYNADDDVSLDELVRQEKFGAGSGEQKDMNAAFAKRIATDSQFVNDLDYMDDEADRFARRRMRSDAQKRMFAINDYAKTKKALDACQFCFKDDTKTSKEIPPQMPLVALGTRAYLALPRFEELVQGHTYIVPLQHHLCSLEADDDTWDEIRNFMKTLMQMFANQDKGIIFYETVTSHKGQRHSYIEAVPVPWEIYDQLPGYFKESLLTIESEWSQHKKVIDFSQRPGGFRRSMVPNLPYFMVQWDYKGEKGYGHVIEGHDGVEGGEEGFDLDVGEKGGGQFPRYFAAEIIGNLLDLEPRKWRRPRKVDFKHDRQRVNKFMSVYKNFDWTPQLRQQQQDEK